MSKIKSFEESSGIIRNNSRSEMYIGSLFHDQAPTRLTYAYYQRGTNTIYPPDHIKEAENVVEFRKENGNLFYGSPVAWRETVLLKDGIDIKISFGIRCFVDHIIMELGKESMLEGVEVLTLENGCERKIGAYSPESGNVLSGKSIMIAIGLYCEHIFIRLNGCCKPIQIQKLDVLGAIGLEKTVWPTPDLLQSDGLWIPITQINGVRASKEDEVFAATYFCEKVLEKTGVALQISESVGDLAFCLLENVESETNEESFSVEIGVGGGYVKAYDRRGLLYGAEALLQKIQDHQLECFRMKDSPFMNFRGIHLALPPKDQLPFLKKLVKYVLVPMHYNVVILQIAGAMQYEQFPEINQRWQEACEKYEAGEWPIPAHYGFVSRDIWKKHEVRELCEYLESFGLEVIPEIQSFSHSQYITAAYPQLAEKILVSGSDKSVNLNEEDEMTDEFYPSCLCPSHPDYDRIVLGILDEVLEVVRPKRYVHMGHDEIIIMGKCPVCSSKSKGELYAEEVTRLNTYIKSKNLTMMIWSDMLQQQRYAVPMAIGKIPKDVIMMDFVWYFHMEEDLEDRLLSHGFKVIMGNMYSSHYPRFRKRAHKKGLLGAEVSTWVPCNEISYAYEGKMFDFVYSAEGMWNSEYQESMRLTYYEAMKPLLADIRRKIGGIESSKEEKHVNVVGDRKSIPYDIRDIVSYPDAIKVGNTMPMTEIPVNDHAEVITFVHATDKDCQRVMWKAPVKIGEYILCYEDGSEWTETISYASNIYKYLSPFGDRNLSSLFRHEGYFGTYLAIPECGKTHGGADYTLGRYSIRNPYPDKKINYIKLVHTCITGANILLFDIILQ